MINVLEAMAMIMNELGLNYDYLELKKSLSYPYVIGEYYDTDYSYETNSSNGEFLLTLWDKNKSSLNILSLNEKIKNRFKNKVMIMENGTTVFFSYLNSLPELQEGNNLKKQEIRIDVQYFEKGE